MLVLVLLACLAAEPERCTTVSMMGRYARHECVVQASQEARRFEARNPGWRVSRTDCQRLRGKLA